MKRWDRLVERYLEEYRARGVSAESVAYTQARLDRWGRWLKRRHPRVAIERIDTDFLVYLVATAAFGDALFGARLRCSAGLPPTSETERRFRLWLAALIRAHTAHADKRSRE